MQRPRPTPDLRFVFRPESDSGYRHFEGHESVPFDAGAAQVTRAHAWWLADAALLTYWDPGEAIARFAAAGLVAELIEGGDTQLYVAFSADAVLVVFRGTQPDRFGDMFDNAQFGLAPWDHGPGSVHRGFKGALERVWDRLAGRLGQLAGSRTVWFGGHSLGAALATLAASRFPETAGVSTIASPRVGDRLFAAAFDARFGARALRYANDADIVTHVPPALPPPFPLPYEHAGQLRHILPDGSISTQAPALAHFVREVFGDVGHLREVVQALKAGVMRRAPDFLDSNFSKSKLLAVGHSFGGQAFGLLPRPERIAAALTVGSQSGYWRHWPLPFGRAWMWGAAHIGMRITPHLLGYFPGSRLGLGEDLPAGVLAEWGEWCRHPRYLVGTLGVEKEYARFNAPIRLYAITDDAFAPPRAVEALADLYPNSKAEIRRVTPREANTGSIGHFGFFRERFRDSLWREARDWLEAQ